MHLPEEDWQTWACGLEAKGPRLYAWQLGPGRTGGVGTSGSGNPTRIRTTDSLTSCTRRNGMSVPLRPWCGWTARAGALNVPLRMTSRRVGLDEHEVRSVTGWYRHIITDTGRSWPCFGRPRPWTQPRDRRTPARLPVGSGRAESGSRSPTTVGVVAAQCPCHALLASWSHA